jgi:nucleoporin POM152
LKYKSTAKLNPGDAYYCLPQGQNKETVYIPIVLNNTVPQKLTLTRHDFDTGIIAAHEYPIKDLQRATETGNAMNGIESYYIPVRKPGAYAVTKIISNDGVDVRLYRRQAFVFTCPTAHIKHSQKANHCTGSKETLEIQVTGVPPLKVEYIQKLGLKSTPRELNRIQPLEFTSPLQRLSNGLASVDPSFFTSVSYDDLTWAATQTISMSLNLTFTEATHHDYNLVRVVDGAGNTVDLANKAPQSFNVHPRPVAKLDCSMTKSTNLLIGQKSVPLPLLLKGTGPFNIEYYFVAEGSDQKQYGSVFARTNKESISAQTPGVYTIVSVGDSYCEGDVLHPSSCQVEQPPLPLVKLQSNPIPSVCNSDSEVGMKFMTEFEGLKSYLLEYTVSKHTGRNKVIVERKIERADQPRHIFSHYPSSSGEYTYDFVALSDGNYKKLDPRIPPIQQVVHPQPDAQFSPKHSQAARICLADKTSVNVDLTGSGPFTLEWTLDGKPYSEVVKGNNYVIQLPTLNTTGLHIVSLTQIVDGNNCVKDLESRDFTIDVRRDRPVAFFYTGDEQDGTVEIQQGAKVKLPLRLTGEGPWDVTYRNVELGDRSKTTVRFNDPNAELQVEDIGHYELLMVKDTVCKGDVLPPQYIVRLIDKPTVAIAESQAQMMKTGVYERRSVCQGINDAIDIEFTGRGPFYCTYKQYHGLTGKRDYNLISTEEITSGLTRVHLPMITRQNGKYRYVFDKLSDQRYTQPFQVSALQIEQTVHAIPTVAFRSRSRKERVLCVGDNLSSTEMAPIVLDLTGQAPFTVKLNIRHNSQASGQTITLSDINTSTYTLKLADELDLAGEYSLKLVGVSDVNGCEATVNDSEDTRIIIKTLDIASISPVEGCGDVCVGGKLDYSLSGVGPFTVCKFIFIS